MQFAAVRKVILMNNLTHLQYEARKSLQKCYLPAAISTMNNRRQEIPYFLRSFARKAKTDATADQSLVSQDTDNIISTPSSVSSLSYVTPHSYTRRNKFLISSDDQHQYTLKKRVKEDTYRFIDTPILEKQISTLSTKKKSKEIDSDVVISAEMVSETQVDELSGSSENPRVVNEEEERKLRAVISNTVNRLRQWHYTEYGKRHLQSSQYGLEFTVTSYNILAQELLEGNSWLYRRVEPEVLKWNYRSRNLIRELRALQSDIICLQEVQSDHYESIFKPNFQALGYKCLYKKRTGEKSDGCAVFFRKSMFTLVKCQEVEFNKHGIPLLDRDNVGLIVLLRPCGLPACHDSYLCVATTHLLFNPRRGDVKLAQLRLLLAEIDCLAYKKYCNIEKTVKYYPVILCGDMNSEPFSPLYDFLCKGRLNCDSLLSGDISGQEEGANRGRILNIKELLHPGLAITESSQFSGVQKSREGQGSTCFSDNSKEMAQNEIVDQHTQWPCDSSEALPLCKTEIFSQSSKPSSLSPARSSSPQPMYSSLLQPAPSSSPSPVTTIYHYFNFNSAYTHFCGGKHEVTTHHSRANCTVDYIFYSAQNKNQSVNNGITEQTQLDEGPLYHLGSYRLLNDTEMEELGGLPNSYQSSDHLSLASKFLLKFS